METGHPLFIYGQKAGMRCSRQTLCGQKSWPRGLRAVIYGQKKRKSGHLLGEMTVIVCAVPAIAKICGHF
jgi:hypothetical protein